MQRAGQCKGFPEYKTRPIVVRVHYPEDGKRPCGWYFLPPLGPLISETLIRLVLK